MTKFGILKSKIENVLLESYKNDTFKDELKTFKKLVLENKNVSKIFYMYDELNTRKGLNDLYSREYIHECITLYENAVNKILPADLKKLNTWVKNTKSDNSYENIDNLFSTDVLTIESRLKSKNLIHFHPGKLPLFRGATSIYYSLLRKKEIGCSTIIMSSDLDGGNLLFDKKFSFPKKTKDIDKKYDIEIRKICLEYLLKNFKKLEPKPQKKINKLHYYLAHPIIRKLAMMKMKS